MAGIYTGLIPARLPRTSDMATYSVLYLNADSFRDAMFITAANVDLGNYRLVAEVEADSPDGVFRDMNAVDGTELCCQLRVRSMSVGDLLIRRDTLEVLLCASCGWDVVQQGEAA